MTNRPLNDLLYNNGTFKLLKSVKQEVNSYPPRDVKTSEVIDNCDLSSKSHLYGLIDDLEFYGLVKRFNAETERGKYIELTSEGRLLLEGYRIIEEVNKKNKAEVTVNE